MTTVGVNIKKRRETLGMTQEELARKLNYKSKSTINKIEMGINDITQSKVTAFAAALDTTPACLMGWDEIQTDKSTRTSTDERDIARDLEKMIYDMKHDKNGPLYYNGVEIDDTSLELLANAIESAMRQMKIINKEKFTSGKHKK